MIINQFSVPMLRLICAYTNKNVSWRGAILFFGFEQLKFLCQSGVLFCANLFRLEPIFCSNLCPSV
jgi:hypothetical protein